MTAHPARLAYFYPRGHEAHFMRGHPERPARVEAIVQALQGLNAWDSFPRCEPVEMAENLLLQVHSRSLLDRLAETAGQGGLIDWETYLSPESWGLALKAGGGACAIAQAVWERKADKGFALCRPPGHHATPSRAMGFCLMNNIAIAAEYLQTRHSAGKLAVIDIDLHHGNGTQDIFYDRGDVLFISTHQHPLYPGTGMAGETGSGEGAGATVNIPLPPFSGDRAFESAVDKVVLPILRRFQPEMLLVSAGMDAHWRDPLGHLVLSADGYGKIVRTLTAFADANCSGRMALFLEGGYDLEGGSACAASAVSALLGRPYSDPVGPSPQSESRQWERIIRLVQEMHGIIP